MESPSHSEISGGSEWLVRHARNVTSQHGEDGIIEQILHVIGATNGWCVEFGAWDGVAMSNTFNLIANRGYRAVLIEGGRRKFRQLVRNYRDNPRVIAVNAMVGLDEASGLDRLLARHAPELPHEFDLLSIDIDGNDYHVWEDTRRYRPKVVVIEYNPTIPNEVDFVQPRDPQLSQGNSARALVRLGQEKGYALVAVTWSNLLFVDVRHFAAFRIDDNALETLRTDTSLITYIFSGYDGSVLLAGCQRLPWHRFPIRASRVQQLPRWLRRYPGHYGLVRRVIVRLFERWHYGPRQHPRKPV